MTKSIRSKSSSYKKSNNFCHSPEKRYFNLKYFNIVLFTGIIGLSVFYLVMINNLTVQGFYLQKIRIKSDNLASINMNKQEEVNLAKTSEFLNSRLADLNLVAVKNVQYLTPRSSFLAKK